MRRYFSFSLIAILSIFILFSCQKEASFEVGQVSKGSLLNAAGNCSPVTIGGTFKATQALADSNYIEVTVDATQTGTYTITTDTVNGYYFKGTGSFSTTGSHTVRLNGFGTPTAAGVDDFEIRYDGTTCSVSITVLTGGSTGGGSSVFTLAGSPTTCTSFNLQGSYTQGTALAAANKVSLQVNVTTAGSWTLSTNTVTGFSFSGSGNFTSTGTQTITLNGSGTPTAAGQQTFTVTVGSSSCTFTVTVLPNTAPQAVFTLQGAPGACASFNVAGTYTQGTALSASNTVSVQVNVTTAGQWVVTTNTVAGMIFAGAGTFTSTGVQTITLNGTGTPSAAGSQTFTVTAGTSTCTFQVTVSGGTQPNTDHFPLTANSYWTYNDAGGNAGDTVKRVNDGTTTDAGNSYRVITEYDNTGSPQNEYHYRKTGNNYYEYTFADNWSVLTFDNNVEGDILFLKEGLATGDTWFSNEFTGTESGINKKLRYSFTCTNANTSITVNGHTFNNVYKITWKSQVSTNGGAYADEGLVWESYFAQGVGLVDLKGSYLGNTIEWQLRFYQIF